MTLSHPRRLTLLVFGMGIPVASLLGWATTVVGPMILTLPLLLSGGLLMLLHPAVGMVLIAGSIPIEAATMVGGATIAKILGVLLFGVWLLRKLVRRESWRSIQSTGLFKIGVLFTAYVVVSLGWARYRTAVYKDLVVLLQLLLWSLLVLDLGDSWPRLAWLAKALVIGAILASLFTLDQYFGGDVRRAGEDIAGGINNTATRLVTIVPLAFYLIRAQKNLLWRLVGLAYVPLAVVAVATTLSRMNLLLLPAIVLIQYWETLKGGDRRRWIILLTGIMVLGTVSVVPWDEVRARADTIVPYIDAAVETEDDMGTMSGRPYHFKVGMTIFRDYPLFGVGYNNYGHYFLDYQLRVPGSNRLYETPRNPHSSYIGILVDLGVFGLILWIALSGVALYNYVVSWTIARRKGSVLQFYLVQALTYSFVLQIIYGFYAETNDDKLFWLLLGLSAAVRRVLPSKGEPPHLV